MARTHQQRIILGLKVRQARQERGWNFEELSRRSGISLSYLNEIEKGKKYPQPDNLAKLAAAFELPVEQLLTPELTKQYAPVGELLQSNFLNDLPLELFGIEMQQVVEIIARAPGSVNAFISALLEIARNYSLRDEHFYFAALRAYQELHMNYLEDVETAAEDFVKANHLPENGAAPAKLFSDLLVKLFDYRIDDKGLQKIPELSSLRSVFIPKKRRLLLNNRLTERQRAFQLAKELGFNVLQLRERPYASSLLRVRSFEEALNNYKAAYFAVAILVNRTAFIRDLTAFFSQPAWNAQFLFNLLAKYQCSPEVLFQRFNVLSKAFDVQRVFFLRFIHDLTADTFELDKELHLNRRHQPHASGLNEHYCRRWASLNLLRELSTTNGQAPIIGVQREIFLDSGEEYLVFAVAKPGYPVVGRNVGVTIGIQLDENAQRTIRFWDDPNIPVKTVNVACERCPMVDCEVRAAKPEVLERKLERKQVLDVLNKLIG